MHRVNRREVETAANAKGLRVSVTARSVNEYSFFEDGAAKPIFVAQGSKEALGFVLAYANRVRVLSAKEREQVVIHLHKEGLKAQDISAATGVSVRTVRRLTEEA
jgi:DNA-directed RNA polymerase specialized sigma24 family protein